MRDQFPTGGAVAIVVAAVGALLSTMLFISRPATHPVLRSIPMTAVCGIVCVPAAAPAALRP